MNQARRIILRSASGIGPLPECFTDTLSVKMGAAVYDFEPVISSAANPPASWARIDDGPVFEAACKKALQEAALLINNNALMRSAPGAFSIDLVMVFSDGSRKEQKDLALAEPLKPLLQQLRLLVPENAKVPPVLEK